MNSSQEDMSEASFRATVTGTIRRETLPSINLDVLTPDETLLITSKGYHAFSTLRSTSYVFTAITIFIYDQGLIAIFGGLF
jgi:hypothetical protein